MAKQRWIMYIQQNIPGNQSFDLQAATSLRDAVERYREYCKAVMYGDCSATLYVYSADSWTSAKEFEDIGCPFDYPDRIIERGPHGGVVINQT